MHYYLSSSLPTLDSNDRGFAIRCQQIKMAAQSRAAIMNKAHGRPYLFSYYIGPPG